MNPHFLFNALTTIGYLIQTAPPRALETLMRLTSLLRAVLRSEGEFTTLGRELDMIECVPRHRARAVRAAACASSSMFRASLRNIRVPPLVLQPVVENAVKHGIAPLRAGGEVRVRATIERSSDLQALALWSSRTPAQARPRTHCDRGAKRASGCATSSAASQVSTARGVLDRPHRCGSGNDRRDSASSRTREWRRA